MSLTESFANWYNKNYKLLLIIPAVLLISSLAILGYSFIQTGDFLEKDITLTGGTSITIITENQELNIDDIRNFLSKRTSNFYVREITDIRSGAQKAVIIESPDQADDLKLIIEEFLNYNLTDENSSIESTGSSLSKSFYNQLKLAIVISFILMSIVVFFIFRSFVPSFAVILSAFADIIMTLAIVYLLGMKLSTAGITAILMLIGYSVDTDIMLTTRLLKREGEINKNIYSAFKTGITMTLTTFTAIAVALFITQSFSNVLEQIFSILLIGLIFDIFNTWVTNASLLKWYLERKNKK